MIVTNNTAYVVEVKLKPTVDDVRELLTKANSIRDEVSRDVLPILTGAYIGVRMLNHMQEGLE